MADRTRKRPGKPLRPERRRERRVQVMLRQDEFALVARAAGEEYLSVWARDVLVGAAKAASPPRSRREIAEALRGR